MAIPGLLIGVAGSVFVSPEWPLLIGDIDTMKSGITLHRDFEIAGLHGSTIRFFVKKEPTACYSTLADVPSMPQYMPGLSAVSIVEERGQSKVLRYRSQVPLIADFTLLRHFEPPKRIWWSKVKAAYRRIEGEWALIPVAGGTVLSYTLAIETGNAIPNWLAVEFQKQGTAQLARNVRNRIESGGKWVRPDYK